MMVVDLYGEGGWIKREWMGVWNGWETVDDGSGGIRAPGGLRIVRLAGWLAGSLSPVAESAGASQCRPGLDRGSQVPRCAVSPVIALEMGPESRDFLGITGCSVPTSN
jgi:hypothetical protein